MLNVIGILGACLAIGGLVVFFISLANIVKKAKKPWEDDDEMLP